MEKMQFVGKIQPSGARCTRPSLTMPHSLRNPKWPLGGPEMANRVWKVFDPSTPSMRKGCDEGEKNRV